MKKSKKKKKQPKKKQKKKLQELHKIAQEHFRSLQPTEHRYRQGNHLKQAYIRNYEYLGYTLEAILNVCIMGLDGYDQCDEIRNIKEAHKQFADVLEFTKNLIPHEEFEFLDKSRRLLLTPDDLR